MRRIEEWLGDLGLGEYASRFVENDIDLSIARDLSDQNLKDLGIASVGHRLKLLRAVSEQSALPAEIVSVAKPPTFPPEHQSPSVEPERLPVRDVSGERRYLTVLFCDLLIRRGLRLGSMPRSGAMWSAPILRRPQRL